MEIQASPIKVYRNPLSLDPDHTKVITRFFYPGEERKEHILDRIMDLPEEEVLVILEQTLKNFSKRHFDIKRVFLNNFNRLNVTFDLSLEKRLLIGSYFTMEYAVETAALLNPSIVSHFDQSSVKRGEQKVILSFRAVGEGHMSSVVFREGCIKKNGELILFENNFHLDKGKIDPDYYLEKHDLIIKLKEIGGYESVKSILNNLLDHFTYAELKESAGRYIRKYGEGAISPESMETFLWLTRSNFRIDFNEDQHLSARVIFPTSKTEIKALEDARFVKFREDDGRYKYYATYTAYDGKTTLPQLISTRNFLRFKIATMMGPGSENKGMALFPEKINGKFAMISRNDNENLFLMYSHRVNYWENPVLLRKPSYYWEFVQIGNNGSPLKTKEGWLLITHGVGNVRTYCIGAILLNQEDPSKVIKETKDPILFPLESERDGYVPNVVYSCGSIINGEYLIIPYAISDTRSGVSKLKLQELLDCMHPV